MKKIFAAAMAVLFASFIIVSFAMADDDTQEGEVGASTKTGSTQVGDVGASTKTGSTQVGDVGASTKTGSTQAGDVGAITKTGSTQVGDVGASTKTGSTQAGDVGITNIPAQCIPKNIFSQNVDDYSAAINVLPDKSKFLVVRGTTEPGKDYDTLKTFSETYTNDFPALIKAFENLIGGERVMLWRKDKITKKIGQLQQPDQYAVRAVPVQCKGVVIKNVFQPLGSGTKGKDKKDHEFECRPVQLNSSKPSPAEGINEDTILWFTDTGLACTKGPEIRLGDLLGTNKLK